MSVTTVPSAITGQTLSAADWNTQVRDNINGIWVLTTAGDMLYATGASAAARLALVTGGIVKGGASAPEYLAAGSLHTFLRSNGSAPEYGSLMYRRQGGSFTVWTNPGTTNYTPTNTLRQAGTKNISISGGVGSSVITYPVAFTERPLIFLSTNLPNSLAYSWCLGWTDDTTSGFTFHIKFTGAYVGTVGCSWMAEGA